MPTVSVELIGRQVNSSGAQREYYLSGVGDEADILTFISSLPATVAGFPFADFDAKEEKVVGDFTLTAKWGEPDYQNQQSPGTTNYKFSYQAPSAHIYQSLATINVYVDDDLLGFGWADHGGAINIVNDGGKQRVEGYNAQPPPEIYTLSYADVKAAITSSYLATVRNLCGKVNSTAFRGTNAGESMLVKAQGELKGGTWNLDFGFGYYANQTGLTYGNITGVAKDGMDLMWPYFQATKDASAKMLIKRPAAIIIERIYERADLNLLNLPA